MLTGVIVNHSGQADVEWNQYLATPSMRRKIWALRIRDDEGVVREVTFHGAYDLRVIKGDRVRLGGGELHNETSDRTWRNIVNVRGDEGLASSAGEPAGGPRPAPAPAPSGDWRMGGIVAGIALVALIFLGGGFVTSVITAGALAAWIAQGQVWGYGRRWAPFWLVIIASLGVFALAGQSVIQPYGSLAVWMAPLLLAGVIEVTVRARRY